MNFERRLRRARDPSERELREAVLPHARLLGCTCRFAVSWRRCGDHARVAVEHKPWCRVGRDGYEPIVIVRPGR
jgi:hypothetical protein